MTHALRRDLRYAARSLWRSPGFTLLATLTIAIGIGATTAIFGFLDVALIRPLPYAAPERLVVINEVMPGRPLSPVNALHFREWRTATRSFEDMGLVGIGGYTLTGVGEAMLVPAARVTTGFFSTLGIRPALGRLFVEADDTPGRDDVVVLEHELWAAAFGSDPNVVGRTITLDGRPNLVIGVLPVAPSTPRLTALSASVGELRQPRLWKPFAATANDLRPAAAFNHIAVARLRSGVSHAQAVDDLNGVQAFLARQLPERAEFRAAITPMRERIAGPSGAALQLAFAVVALVFFIACVNVANLLVARGGRRRREFAVRAATGATRGQLVLQGLVESALLSTIGGGLGVAVSALVIAGVRAYAPPGVPRLDEVGVDGRVVGFAIVATFFSIVMTGLLPSWRFSRVPLTELRSSTITAASSSSAGRLRSILVGTEVAASTVCLVVGALLVASFVNVLGVDRGFDTERIVTVDMFLFGSRHNTRERGVQFMTMLAERARALPGVTSVGVTDALPLSGTANSAILVEGSAAPRQERPVATIRAADSGYLPTMGIPVHRGRGIAATDARPVAVVSELAAARLWPGQDALGKRFRFGPDDGPLVEVVGVAGNVRSISLTAEPPAHIYLPASFYFYGRGSLAVRTTTDTAGVAAGIREIVRDLDPQVPPASLTTMGDIVAESVAPRRFQMNLVISLAVFAAFLVAIGIYGVVSQSVSQRSGEFGVRMALGSTGRAIRGLILRQGLLPVWAGLAIGVPISLLTGDLLRDFLFGVTPSDPGPIVAAVTFIVAVAVLASAVPAWRASRIDPMRALRAE